MKRLAQAAAACLAIACSGLAAAMPEPSRQLADLVRAAVWTADQVFNGRFPSGSGQVPYSTAAHQATWGTPTAAGLAASTNAPSNANDTLCLPTGTGSIASFNSPSSCQIAMSSNTPTLISQVLCSPLGGSSIAGSWQTPTTCWLTGFEIGHTTSTSSNFGWDAYPDSSGAAYLAYQFGDTGTGLMSYFGGPLQPYAYHGMLIDLNEGGIVPTRTVTENFTLNMHNTGASVLLNAGTSSGAITLTSGTSGNISLNTGSSGSVTLAPGASGQVNINGKVKIGSSGTAYTNFHENSGTWTSTISANTCSAFTYTDATANIGDLCYSSQADVSSGTILTNGLTAVCAITGNGTTNNVSDVFCNSTTSSKSISTYHFRDLVFKH